MKMVRNLKSATFLFHPINALETEQSFKIGDLSLNAYENRSERIVALSRAHKKFIVSVMFQSMNVVLFCSCT